MTPTEGRFGSWGCPFSLSGRWERSDIRDLQGVPGLLAGRPLQGVAGPALVVGGVVLALPRLVAVDVSGADEVGVGGGPVVAAALGDQALVHGGDDRRAVAEGEPGGAGERLVLRGCGRGFGAVEYPGLQRGCAREVRHVVVDAAGAAVLVHRPGVFDSRVAGRSGRVCYPQAVATEGRLVAVEPEVAVAVEQRAQVRRGFLGGGEPGVLVAVADLGVLPVQGDEVAGLGGGVPQEVRHL